MPLAWAHGLLGAMALVAGAVWFDFGAVPRTGGVHRHDVFHYYLGGKFQRELGYGLIYRCTAVAEAEQGREAEVRRRTMRDLDTLEVVPAASALDAPDVCRPRFTPDRWREFREDVTRLRGDVSEVAWTETQTDYGYNPTPAWSLLGGTLARIVPATDLGLRVLCAIDFVLVAGVIWALYAGFGFRIGALAMVLWGTQEPGKFAWLAFCMLREDWLFLLVASVVLLRRDRPALAGATLAWSAAIRVFPAVGLVGVALSGIAAPALRARFATQRRRFVAGFVGAFVGIVALSAVVSGPSSWIEWVSHIRRHVAAPSCNNVGLRVVVGFDPEHRVERVQANLAGDAAPESAREASGAPGEASGAWVRVWSQLVQATERDRSLPLHGLQVAWVVLLVVALARSRRLWMGLPLALLAAPVLTVMSSYYLVFFVVAVAVVPARRWLERGLYTFAGVVQVLMVMPAVGWFLDDRHLALSLAYIGAALAITLSVARRREW